MASQVGKVGFQEAHDFRRLSHIEVGPVLRVQRVIRRELLFRLHHQLAKFRRLVDLDDAHAEMRRHAMQPIQANKRLVNRGRIIVAQLLEVELAEIGVDVVRIAATTFFREVLVDDFRPAEVRETQADNAEGVADAMFLVLFVVLVEVIADCQLMIQHGHEGIERFVVEHLLVERPAQFIQAQLIERRTRTQANDGTVSLFGIEKLSADEVVFAAPEMHFVNELRVGILTDEAVHDFHRLVGLTDFVVRTRHLVEHLVVAFVIRIGL